MSAQIRKEIKGIQKPWLVALRLLVTAAMVVSLVAAPAIFIYVAKQPSQPAERVAILSDTIIIANRSKLETYPISWVGIAAVMIGLGAGVTREWTKREEQRISGLLERRYGFFPPPGTGIMDRLRGD